MERPTLFWIGSSQGLYDSKLGKVIILYLVLHFANPAFSDLTFIGLF